MGHLMASVANLPGYETTHEPVGVGPIVVYHGRTGHLRQGRTEFPALVLAQHPDDGSLELLVFFEPEDVIWERRVLPRSENNTGHCWTPVKAFPGLTDAIAALRTQIFGQWQEPPKSVMDYLADFDGQLAEARGRLSLIEAKLAAFEGK